VTQQNAALVEESAAAADSLKQQAIRLAEVVSVFKLNDGAAQRAIEPAQHPSRQAIAGGSPKPKAASPKRAAPVHDAAAGGKEWETF